MIIESRHVRKRDGQKLQPFDRSKIERAVRAAWESTGDVVKDELLLSVVDLVASTTSAESGVEQIQDKVEVALMRHQLDTVAKAYILYREERRQARAVRQKPDPLAVSSYIHFSKYARHREEWSRRELYDETVGRVEAMHLRRFHDKPIEVLDKIRWAFDGVRDKKVLPSMRSMQFGGKAVEANHNRLYNCSFSHVDRPRIFAEAIFLLLSGCGVGFSVQYDHVNQLPKLTHKINENDVLHYHIEDNIEGWAEAFDALISSYMVKESPYYGKYVEFSYAKIRARGTPLKTSGGQAPGHMELKRSIEKVRSILDDAKGHKLRPIQCHDILCIESDAVLSGGIRRSAAISLFSFEDSEMMNAKTGKWWETHPWRANANNSVAVSRADIKKAHFQRVFEKTQEWGEPGFVFVEDLDYGTNPCAEIGLYPKLKITAEIMLMLHERVKRGKPMPLVQLGDVYSGWAFCNLCEVNASKLRSPADFLEAAEMASIIGTLQATYTDMPYLGWVSEVITERDALLGIGMVGMMDSPEISLKAEYQREAAALVVHTNKVWANELGIRQAARTTCVKPSGTTSLALGCVGSGIHAHHAKRYVRTVTATDTEVGFKLFREKNPHMCVKIDKNKWLVEFPVEAPEGAHLKEHFTAVQFLELVKSTQLNWVLPGTVRTEDAPGLNHNVSNTATVGADEWVAVSEYIWNNRDCFTGISLLSSTGDKDYDNAPYQAVRTPADEARWNKLLAGYQPVDYESIIELEDGTTFSAEAACLAGGGKC